MTWIEIIDNYPVEEKKLVRIRRRRKGKPVSFEVLAFGDEIEQWRELDKEMDLLYIPSMVEEKKGCAFLAPVDAAKFFRGYYGISQEILF